MIRRLGAAFFALALLSSPALADKIDDKAVDDIDDRGRRLREKSLGPDQAYRGQ